MPLTPRPSFQLPLLLLGAFRALIDDLHAELAEHGHGDARPLHGFALQAIGPAGTTTSELGRTLGVSKQAAAKTVGALERVGYVRRQQDPSDARAVRLLRTEHGEQMLRLSAQFFQTRHRQLARTLGRARLAELEDDLQRIAGPTGGSLGGLPGWMT